jgi:hypothetical protein
MSLRDRFKNRLYSLQEDITAGYVSQMLHFCNFNAIDNVTFCFSVKHLSTQASLGGVHAAVAAVAASGISSGGSPEYRPVRVNLEAGSELLEVYQSQWEEIHVGNERNARIATR